MFDRMTCISIHTGMFDRKVFVFLGLSQQEVPQPLLTLLYFDAVGVCSGHRSYLYVGKSIDERITKMHHFE